MKHHFIATSQANHLEHLKESIKQGEFIVSLDFAENYSFVIQDAIQSHHWNNDQVTIHPYVVYYRRDNELKHHNLAIVSECNKHDSTAVNLFNKKMISYLKKIHGEQNVKKLIFFSDGAGSQYKNKYNFANIATYKKAFDISVEWHFFATSHGKGPCDGIGGTIKCLAKKASLQRHLQNQITTPKSFFEWAKAFFKNIDFDFSTSAEYNSECRSLRKRRKNAIAIKNTRQFHSFEFTGGSSIICRLFSAAESYVECEI